jgi:hypothetical protein
MQGELRASETGIRPSQVLESKIIKACQQNRRHRCASHLTISALAVTVLPFNSSQLTAFKSRNMPLHLLAGVISSSAKKKNWLGLSGLLEPVQTELPSPPPGTWRSYKRHRATLIG